jgi:hypothetical protein
VASFAELPSGDPGLAAAQEAVDAALEVGLARNKAFGKAFRTLTHGKGKAAAPLGGLLGAGVPMWVYRRHLAAMNDIANSQRIMVSTSSQGLFPS